MNLSSSKDAVGPDPRVDVRILICHRDVELGIRCLSSLLRFCADPVRIVLHDDGSLTEDDVTRLMEGLPGAALVSKEEADDVVRPKLARYPRSLAFRDRAAPGQKMFDIPLMASGDIALCDADILFLRPFSGVFAWPDDAAEMLFLQDTTDSYSLRPWNAKPHRLRHRYNAGLMMMRGHKYDLDQIEALIGFIEDSRDYQRNEPYRWFLEQTCWSAVAGTLDARMWDGAQMRVIDRNDRHHPDMVAGHFVGAVRPLLDVFENAAHAAGVADLAPVRVRSSPAADCTTFNFVQRRIRNKLRRATGV